MKLRRGRILLSGQQLLKGQFLLGRPLQHQGQLSHPQIRRHGAPIVGRAGPQRTMIGQDP